MPTFVRFDRERWPAGSGRRSTGAPSAQNRSLYRVIHARGSATSFAATWVARWRALGLGALALVMLCATSAAHAQRVSTDFDMEFPNGNETSLISEVESFLTGKYITHSFFAGILDGIAKVKWEDKNGVTLLTGVSNQTLIIFAPTPGIVATSTAWSTRLGAGPLANLTRVANGIGDFTGSQTSKDPCIGLRCPAKYLEPAPSAFRVGASPSQSGARTAEIAAAGPILIGETEGRLGAHLYTSLPSVDPDAFTTVTLLTFASTVEQIGSEYAYTYTVTNESESALEFNWEAAGLSGELEASGSTSRSFVSALAPISRSSLATGVLGGFDAGGSLDLLTPVPEPSQLLFLLAGAALLAYRYRRSIRWTAMGEPGLTSRSSFVACTALAFIAIAASPSAHSELVRATMTGEVTLVAGSITNGADFGLDVGDPISITAIYDDADRVITGSSSESVFVKPGTGYTMTINAGRLTFTEVQDRNYFSLGLTPAVVYGTGPLAGQVGWNYFADFGINGAPATFDALSSGIGEWLAGGDNQTIAGTWLASTLQITPIPEASTCAFLIVGAGLLGLTRCGVRRG